MTNDQDYFCTTLTLTAKPEKKIAKSGSTYFHVYGTDFKGRPARLSLFQNLEKKIGSFREGTVVRFEGYLEPQTNENKGVTYYKFEPKVKDAYEIQTANNNATSTQASAVEAETNPLDDIPF
jgi:hypothetical protein